MIDAPGDSVDVLLKVYTVAGRLIRILKSNGGLAQVQIPWDGLDAEGQPLARGVYLFKAQVFPHIPGTGSDRADAEEPIRGRRALAKGVCQKAWSRGKGAGVVWLSLFPARGYSCPEEVPCDLLSRRWPFFSCSARAAPPGLRGPAALSIFNRVVARTGWALRASLWRTIRPQPPGGIPPALGFVGRTGVELTYAQLVPGLASDVNYNYLTFVHPLQGWGAFGVGIVFLSYGQSEGSDDQGNPTGTFGSNEFSPAVYYGTQIFPISRWAPRSSGSASSWRRATSRVWARPSASISPGSTRSNPRT